MRRLRFSGSKGRRGHPRGLRRMALISALCLTQALPARAETAAEASTPAIWTASLNPPQPGVTEASTVRGDRESSPAWQALGTGTARYFGIRVYDAVLEVMAAAAVTDAAQAVLDPRTGKRLTLTYQRALGPERMVEAAEVAFARQFPDGVPETLAAGVARLHEAYQAVEAGDGYRLEWQPAGDGGVLALWHLPADGAERLAFRSSNAELARAYFGIWLGEQALSEPLRTALLGGADAEAEPAECSRRDC